MTKTAERIKERRLLLDMSQLALAYKIGKSLTQVIRYEKGENDPTGEVLIALASNLETTTDYLLGLTDDPSVRHVGVETNPTKRAAKQAIDDEDYEEAVKFIELLRASGKVIKGPRHAVSKP